MIAPTTSSPSGPFQNVERDDDDDDVLLLCPPPLPSPSRRPRRRCFCRRAEVPKTAFVVGRAAALIIIAREQYVVGVARSTHYSALACPIVCHKGVFRV